MLPRCCLTFLSFKTLGQTEVRDSCILGLPGGIWVAHLHMGAHLGSSPTHWCLASSQSGLSLNVTASERTFCPHYLKKVPPPPWQPFSVSFMPFTTMCNYFVCLLGVPCLTHYTVSSGRQEPYLFCKIVFLKPNSVPCPKWCS